MDSVSEIKARISIEDLVSQYVQLKKAGRHFKALCPFHKERTPSFYVSPERQLAYCFGCHKGGDHFKFIEEIEGLDFRGALQFLAEKAGVKLPQITPDEYRKKTERDRLIESHESAATYFETQLWNTEEGEKVLKYLKKRGLEEKTIKEARLGFAPDKNDELTAFLLKRDFTKNEILASGLAFAREFEREGGLTDRFRMRLIFPIQNLTGQICAFGGRAVREGDEPKYLNSPETSIYHKNSVLYGLSLARHEIRPKGNAIIVEGYMDVLSLHQAGFKNVVASSGTALTENQLSILKRFTKEIVFAFDGDEAGKLATQRAIETAFTQEFLIKVAVWDEKFKDPDECVRKSPKIFQEALDAAKPATLYLIDIFKQTYGTATIDGKKKIINLLLPFWAVVKSPLELDEWLKQITLTLGVSASVLYDELKRFSGKQKVLTQSRLHSVDENVGVFSVQEYLLGLILTYPETLSIASQYIASKDFDDKQLENIYRSITTQYNQSPEELQRSEILKMYIEARSSDMQWDVVQKEVLEAVRTLKKQQFDREKRSLVNQMKGVSKDASSKEKTRLLESYQELLTKEEQLLSKIS